MLRRGGNRATEEKAVWDRLLSTLVMGRINFSKPFFS
jgi:hypothetical protein